MSTEEVTKGHNSKFELGGTNANFEKQVTEIKAS